ncbi:MAG TPA: YggS family pyridoxal phosphate-dependent enzyme [Terriglobales bacterium]|nr:YggS family pyridoxal phosphate-dependent enzyme [Terriglobales bacterium]
MKPILTIKENLAAVRERIAAAARRAGRSPDEVALMAVTKTFGPDAIRAAHDAGQRLFGENRVQEFAEKAATVRDLDGAEFHMIGHLQTNKAAKAVEIFSTVDSVDSLRLADKLNAAAAHLRKRLPVLIELNLGSEESKSGLNPVSTGFGELLEAAARLDHLEFRGLMTIPPFTDDPRSARPYFRRLREIRDNIARRNLPGVRMDVLSMGMSHDFEVAVEEGSTCVRLGTAIFGGRAKA